MRIPLSTVQQSTVEWIVAGGHSSFGLNVSLSLRLRGPLSISALARALAVVIRRHEGLRSRIHRSDGSLGQSFADVPDTLDLRPIPVACFEQAEARIAACLAARLDLEQDGPLRIELLQLSDHDHVLLLVLSHTATDTHADDLFLSELLSAYDCAIRDVAPALPPAMSLSEHVAAETQAGSVLGEAQLQYWARIIRGCTPALPCNAPGDAAVVADHGRIVQASLSAATTRRLEELAAASKVSLMAMLCSVIFIAIWKQYALADVCAFMTHAGRDSRLLKSLGASVGRDFLVRVGLTSASSVVYLAQMVQTALLRGSISSRLPFTHERAIAQLAAQGAAMEASTTHAGLPPRAHLHITDALRVGAKLPNVTPHLTVERVMPGPLLHDYFHFDAPRDGTAQLDAPYAGVLNLLLRRDLCSEPGESITFVGVFVESTLNEAAVRTFLATICRVADLVARGEELLPIAAFQASNESKGTT